MYLSSPFIKLTRNLVRLSAIEGIVSLIVIGIIGILIAIHFTTSTVVVEPLSPQEKTQEIVTLPTTGMLNEGQSIPVDQGEQVLPNPFALLPEINGEQNNVPPKIKNQLPEIRLVGDSKNMTSTINNLKLTGIVSAENQQMAVIMSGNKSKLYSLNDLIDTYKLISIHHDSVMLEKNNQNLVLHLEAAGHSGGKF